MTERSSCSPLTCQLDGLTHLVTDEAAHAGRLARGTYRAVCGALVRAAPMTVPPGPPCLACKIFRSARSARCGGLGVLVGATAEQARRAGCSANAPTPGRGAEPLPRRPHPGRFPSY